jgi:hypothetical protein
MPSSMRRQIEMRPGDLIQTLPPAPKEDVAAELLRLANQPAATAPVDSRRAMEQSQQ